MQVAVILLCKMVENLKGIHVIHETYEFLDNELEF